MSEGKTLLAIFLVAFAVRIIFVSTLEEGYYFADSARYDAAAKQIVAKNNFPKLYDRAPLYPVFLAAQYSTIGEEIIKTRTLQAFMGGLIATVLAIIGFRTGGYWVGAAAGVLWTIFPMGVFIAGTIYPTTLLTLLLALGVYCLLPGGNERTRLLRLAGAGALFGISALAKPVVLASIGVMCLWLFVVRKDQRFVSACTFGIAAIIVITPWTVRQYEVHGKLIPIEARQLNKVAPWALTKEERARRAHIRLAAVAALKQAQGDPELRHRIEKALEAEAAKQAEQGAEDSSSPGEGVAKKKDPVDMLKGVARRFPREFVSFFELYPRRVGFLNQQQRDLAQKERNPRLVKEIPFGSLLVMAVSAFSVSFLYIFALLGIRAMWLSPWARPYLGLYLGLVLSFAVTYATSWGKIRYRIPVDPYIMLLSAWGLFWAWGAVFGVEEEDSHDNRSDVSRGDQLPRIPAN